MTSSQPVATPNALNFTPDNKRCYAYSGVVTANGVDTIALDFTTNSETIDGSCYYTVNADDLSANFLTFLIKFNETIIAVVKERRDLGQLVDFPFNVIIPPHTHVEVIFLNNGTATDLTAVFTGKAYGMIKTDYQ